MTRPTITKAMRLRVLEDHGAIVCCQGPDCDSAIYISEAELDHHLALIDGGAHATENLRPLCRPCHALKSAHEHRENCRAKRRAKKHSGQDAADKLKRRPLKGRDSLQGRSRPWPESTRKIQSRPFPKKPEAAE